MEKSDVPRLGRAILEQRIKCVEKNYRGIVNEQFQITSE